MRAIDEREARRAVATAELARGKNLRGPLTLTPGYALALIEALEAYEATPKPYRPELARSFTDLCRAMSATLRVGVDRSQTIPRSYRGENIDPEPQIVLEEIPLPHVFMLCSFVAIGARLLSSATVAYLCRDAVNFIANQMEADFPNAADQLRNSHDPDNDVPIPDHLLDPNLTGAAKHE